MAVCKRGLAGRFAGAVQNFAGPAFAGLRTARACRARSPDAPEVLEREVAEGHLWFRPHERSKLTKYSNLLLV
jgi:hypothetical protein